MDPALSAAYSQRVWTRALLVRLDLPGGTYGLTDGGFAYYDGLFYLGKEPSLGLFVGVSGLTSGMGNQTTRVDLRVAPKNNAAASILGSPSTQGSRVRVWRGAIDRETGLLIGEPVLIAGEGATNANPSILKGRTVGQFLTWLHGKTGDWAR